MSRDDVEYYRRRALEERERAAKADSSEAANAHQELARYYESVVARADMQPLRRGTVANQNDPHP
jgi:hypothetical protein